MKHGAFQKFFEDTETMVRKTMNMSGLEVAKQRLLRTICSEDASYTASQLRMLLELAFKF